MDKENYKKSLYVVLSEKIKILKNKELNYKNKLNKNKKTAKILYNLGAIGTLYGACLSLCLLIFGQDVITYVSTHNYLHVTNIIAYLLMSCVFTQLLFVSDMNKSKIKEEKEINELQKEITELRENEFLIENQEILLKNYQNLNNS